MMLSFEAALRGWLQAWFGGEAGHAERFMHQLLR